MFVKAKLDENVYSVVQNKKSRSNVWKYFSQVVDENNVNIPFLRCDKCFKILIKNRLTYSSVLRHPCVKQLQNSELKNIPEEHKKAVINLFSKWVINNSVPFSIVESSSFLDIIKEIVNLAVNFGASINISHLIPHRTTISANIEALYDKEIIEIRREIQSVNFGAITTDLWTDSYRKRSYIAVTLHYVFQEHLIDRTLCVTHFEERQTGLLIRQKLDAIFEEYGLDITGFVYVTDRGSNFISALADMERISCSAHIINNVLNAAEDQSDAFANISRKCKSLVKFFKKSSNLQSTLQTTLKKECDTRWNSKYYMFKSIKVNFAGIFQLLNVRQELDRMDDITLHQIEEIIAFLKPFKDASIDLQHSKKPTLYLCFPYYTSLISKCAIQDSDSECIKEFKQYCETFLKEKWLSELKLQHYAATFLYPKSKELLVVSIEKRLEVHRYIADFSREIRQLDNNDYPTPRPSNSPDIFTVFNRARTVVDISITSEITLYLEDNNNNCEDAWRYWNSKKEILPKLNQVYMALSRIPATSASSERCFSLANNIINAKRSNIKCGLVNMMAVLNSHYKIIEMKKCEV